MIIFSNKYIPFGDYDLMTVWPVIFVKEDRAVSTITLNHEGTHGLQQLGLLLLGLAAAFTIYALGGGWWCLLALPLYYYLYGAFYAIARIRSLFNGKGQEWAYRQNPFEREAYAHEQDPTYNERRSLFAWVPYIWQ